MWTTGSQSGRNATWNNKTQTGRQSATLPFSSGIVSRSHVYSVNKRMSLLFNMYISDSISVEHSGLVHVNAELLSRATEKCASHSARLSQRYYRNERRSYDSRLTLELLQQSIINRSFSIKNMTPLPKYLRAFTVFSLCEVRSWTII